MKSYCLIVEKILKTLNPRVSKTSNGRTMVLSKCAILYVVVKNQDLLKIKKQKDY